MSELFPLLVPEKVPRKRFSFHFCISSLLSSLRPLHATIVPLQLTISIFFPFPSQTASQSESNEVAMENKNTRLVQLDEQGESAAGSSTVPEQGQGAPSCLTDRRHIVRLGRFWKLVRKVIGKENMYILQLMRTPINEKMSSFLC